MSRKINVLLVDDSRTVLAQIERILEEVDALRVSELGGFRSVKRSY